MYILACHIILFVYYMKFICCLYMHSYAVYDSFILILSAVTPQCKTDSGAN